MLESASFHVATCHHHLLHHLTPVCNSVPFFLVFHRVVAPVLCLGSLEPSPCSLGLSSSPGSGGCSSCALLCAVQGCMSAFRTELAANPGGPQGGAQTGRSPGGGAGRKLSCPRSETKCCGASATPQDRFSALQNGHRDATRETRIHPTNITNYKVRHIITTDTSMQ